jgi:hypothetical protein
VPVALISRSKNFMAGAKMTGLLHQQHSQPSRRNTATCNSFGKRGRFGQRYTPMEDWLDEHCGLGGWSMTPAGIRGVINDAVAIYVSQPTCALAFVARWCTDSKDGFYEMREDEPARRVPLKAH